MGRARAAAVRVDSQALLLRRTAYGEADLIVLLLTERRGVVSALARAARVSQRRFGGSLEPFHELHVVVEERSDRELQTLVDARITRTRPRLVASLEAMEAAGVALGWLRHALPQHTAEPEVWALVTRALDALDATPAAPRSVVTALGLALGAALGWGLELQRCVRCDRPCAPTRAAQLDPSRGGLVCRRCGGGPATLSGAQRARLQRATAGDLHALMDEDVPLAARWVEGLLGRPARPAP